MSGVWRWHLGPASGRACASEIEARRDAVRYETWPMRSQDRGMEPVLPEQADALWPAVERLGYAVQRDRA